jgi:quercetin dioxygenase-like cupin family protein
MRQSAFYAANPEVMTVVVEYPAGGTGSHRTVTSAGRAFGYVLDGEMLFELESETPRVTMMCVRSADADSRR